MRSRAEADLLGPRGREEGRLHHRLAGDRARLERPLGARRSRSIRRGQELLVERAPVGADAHGLAVPDRRARRSAPNCRSFLSLKPTLPGLIRYLASASRAGRMVGQELVADIVEVADERDVDAEAVEPLADLRHRGRRLVPVDRDADELGAGAGERRDLRHRGVDIGRVGVGHRLHDDRRAAADRHGSDAHARGPVARRRVRRGSRKEGRRRS